MRPSLFMKMPYPSRSMEIWQIGATNAIAACGGLILSCRQSERPSRATQPHPAKANGDHRDRAMATATAGCNVVTGTRQQSTAITLRDNCTVEVPPNG